MLQDLVVGVIANSIIHFGALVMDVNPICEDRFERLDDQQGKVGRTLSEHGTLLSEHSQTLEHHGRQLARLEEELGRQGDLLSQNQSTLAVLATKITSVETELLRLNGWQMKLIFLLVIALAAIAGVTKLSDIGVFWPRGC